MKLRICFAIVFVSVISDGIAGEYCPTGVTRCYSDSSPSAGQFCCTVSLRTGKGCDCDNCFEVCDCFEGSYCPGDGDRYLCPSGWTTSGTGATSASDCNVKQTSCSAGEYLSGSTCKTCAAGTYSSGGTKTSCTKISSGYYGVRCYSDGTGCEGQTACGIGYWCTGGVRTKCGDNMTTATTTASSASACVCLDGYEMKDGVCTEPRNQELCPHGIGTLYAAGRGFTLYESCDTPALWIGIDGGKCCANLESGAMSGALNIQYGGAVYHTVE